VLDVFYDHRSLSQGWSSSFVSSCVSDISDGEDVWELVVANLQRSLHAHEASIID